MINADDARALTDAAVQDGGVTKRELIIAGIESAIRTAANEGASTTKFYMDKPGPTVESAIINQLEQRGFTVLPYNNNLGCFVISW